MILLFQQHNHLQREVEEHHLGIYILLDVSLCFAQLIHNAKDILFVNEWSKSCGIVFL